MGKEEYTKQFEDLGYKPEGLHADNALIITGLHGLAGQILENFKRIKPANQQQKTARAIALEEMDLWMNTTWREMAEAFGLKMKVLETKEGRDCKSGPRASESSLKS